MKLTINIEGEAAERKIKALLDKLGVEYSIDKDSQSYKWWEDQLLVQELHERSQRLKSGQDVGVTFDEVKRRLNSK
ncbi:hypothetical protein [Albibacterium indicum]|uniref:hypothetical protein n=1 Tax=Albibacterium indicum TaxID=2292082 RepID=UPI000E4B7BE6|nr:hypothetical protein [Pedobacter indicus]